MIRKIFVYPAPVLRREAVAIEVIDDSIRELAEDMIETMISARGIGLAATQVGVSKRLVIVGVEGESDIEVYINPEIENYSGRESMEEGCLSLPGILAPVERPAKITVLAQTLAGEEIEIKADGLLARAFQHEIDHLDGILFIDKVSPVNRVKIKDELQQLENIYKQI